MNWIDLLSNKLDWLDWFPGDGEIPFKRRKRLVWAVGHLRHPEDGHERALPPRVHQTPCHSSIQETIRYPQLPLCFGKSFYIYYTECIRDLDFVKLGNGFRLKAIFTPVPFASKMILASQVVKSDSKMIILLCHSNSVTHSPQTI